MREYDSLIRPHPFIEEAVELVRFRDLVWIWGLRNLTLRYKRSALGVIWTLLEPMLMMAVLSVVFTSVFRFAIDNYPIYLLSGLLMYDFFNRSTNQMIDEMISSESVVRNVYSPRTAFAVAAVGTNLVNWLIALIPLTVLMLVLGADFTPALLTILPAVFVTAVFATGVGLLVATVAGFFHDFKVMYQVLLTALFYVTPIIYPAEIVPERFRWLISLNPVAHLCEIVRQPAFLGQVAPTLNWLVAVLASISILALGWWVFTGHKDEFNYL